MNIYSDDIALLQNITLQVSSVYTSSFPITKAFDGNKVTSGSGDTNIWVSATGTNEWIIVKYNSGAKRIGKYTITNRKDYQHCSPKNWEVYGSNDGITWILLDTRTDVINWMAGETKEFIINDINIVKYQYYKFNLLSTVNSRYYEIAEIQMMEKILTDKYFVTQNNEYYTINPNYYIDNKYNKLPITTQYPTTDNIDLYGFDNINNLVTENTINTQTFKPIDKFIGALQINKYVAK